MVYNREVYLSNTNAEAEFMKNILCFGDSNTWGYTPGSGVRYDTDVRWTGVMQKALGDDYRVIEDGMNARTTVYEDMWSMWRTGKDALPISLIAQKPLDLLIISLGTNDLKFTDVRGSARGIDSLITLTQMVQARKESSLVFHKGVKILVVSPILMHPMMDTESQRNSSLYGGYEESKIFAEHFKRIADARGVEFFDAAPVAAVSPVDGIHMPPESHKALGLALAEKVKAILGE